MKSILFTLERNAYLPAIALCLALVGALGLQHLMGWTPCPLCILQRLTALSLLFALVGFGAAKSRPRLRMGLLWVAGLATAAGLAASGSHLWLLAHPSTASCGPGFARFVMHLVDAIPGSDWLLEGSGACEDTRYVLLGIPLPAFAMLAHISSLSIALVQHFRSRS